MRVRPGGTGATTESHNECSSSEPKDAQANGCAPKSASRPSSTLRAAASFGPNHPISPPRGRTGVHGSDGALPARRHRSPQAPGALLDVRRRRPTPNYDAPTIGLAGETQALLVWTGSHVLVVLGGPQRALLGTGLLRRHPEGERERQSLYLASSVSAALRRISRRRRGAASHPGTRPLQRAEVAGRATPVPDRRHGPARDVTGHDGRVLRAPAESTTAGKGCAGARLLHAQITGELSGWW